MQNSASSWRYNSINLMSRGNLLEVCTSLKHYLTKESNLESKWKQVGDAALASWNLQLAEEAFKAAKDLGSLLLLYSSTGSQEGLYALAKMATESNRNNVAFTCYLALSELEKCIDILVATGRLPEAVIFAKTYKPSMTAGLVKLWKAELVKSGREKIAKTIASPDGNLDLFTGWTELLEAEQSRLGGVAEGIALFVPSLKFAVEGGMNRLKLSNGVNGTTHHEVVA